jgi:hypothetical protein
MAAAHNPEVAMSAVKQERSRLGMIRILSLAVIAAAVFFGGGNTLSGVSGGTECHDYFIHQCTGPASLCGDQTDEPCGEAIPGCAGQGYVECRESAICPEDTVMWTCVFEPT